MNDDARVGALALDLASRVPSLAHHQIIPLAAEFAEWLAPGWAARRVGAQAGRYAGTREAMRSAGIDFDPSNSARTILLPELLSARPSTEPTIDNPLGELRAAEPTTVPDE